MIRIGDIDVSDPLCCTVCRENGAGLVHREFISSEGLTRDTIKSRLKGAGYFIQTGEHLPPPAVLERVAAPKKHRRRHYTNYLKGLPHIKDFKQQLVTCKTLAESEQVSDATTARYKDHHFRRAAPLAIANNDLPADNEMVDCNVYG